MRLTDAASTSVGIAKPTSPTASTASSAATGSLASRPSDDDGDGRRDTGGAAWAA